MLSRDPDRHCPPGQDCGLARLRLRSLSEHMKLAANWWREEKSAANGFATFFSTHHEARSVLCPDRPRRTERILNNARVLCAVVGLMLGLGGAVRATSVIPIADSELYRRADLVVYGVVVSSETAEDARGWPETVTTIRPARVVKGWLGGDLTLHQAGGMLSDGRFFKLWGRPEYTPGHEVVVFAIARAEGDYQTAEMLLGKFEVERDQTGRLFAVPSLAEGPHAEVAIERLPAAGQDPQAESAREEFPAARFLPGPRRPVQTWEEWNASPRDLAGFLDFLDAGGGAPLEESAEPVGPLEAVVHETERSGLTPQWGNINGSLWRYNNGATAGWQLVGTANMTGGGVAEATNALATWTTDPNSTINYTLNSSASNQIQLSAASSPCGWSTCVTSSGGVVGCGGPSGGGSNSWRGESYTTITSGTVWLRCYATANAFGSVLTQSFLTHELGHTLGLAHPDQTASPHDVCLGDENAAIMRSVAQNRTTLGTDDQDAIRWLYGDGGNHCTSSTPTISGVTPPFGPLSGGTPVTITGTNFQNGATVTIGGAAATGVAFVNSTTLTAFTPAGTGTVAVVVTNPDAQTATLLSSFTYQDTSSFYTLPPCRILDTRNPNGTLGGPALTANASRNFTVVGQCGVPSSARALSVNVTVAQVAATGDLRIYAAGGSLTAATTINYRAGVTRANNATVSPSAGGAVTVRCDQPSGTVQLIIDVNGYYQ